MIRFPDCTKLPMAWENIACSQSAIHNWYDKQNGCSNYLQSPAQYCFSWLCALFEEEATAGNLNQLLLTKGHRSNWHKFTKRSCLQEIFFCFSQTFSPVISSFIFISGEMQRKFFQSICTKQYLSPELLQCVHLHAFWNQQMKKRRMDWLASLGFTSLKHLLLVFEPHGPMKRILSWMNPN